MVRRKQSFPETVQLLLSGPKSILNGGTVLVDAKLSHTWIELLTGELGLQVVPQSGIFACTMNYRPSAPRDGHGWRAELTDQIRDFVDKFERNRKKFSVRLCHPNNIIAFVNNHRNLSGHESPQKSAGLQHLTILRPPTPRVSGSFNTRSSGNTPPNQSASLRRPNLVIPTQGSAPVSSTSGASDINGNYEKSPRSSNSNGIGRSPDASRKQQNVYGTRLKRLYEQQTLKETTLGTGHQNGYAPQQQKQRRLHDLGEKSPQQTARRQQRGRGRNNNVQETVPQIQNCRSVSGGLLTAVKIEPVSSSVVGEPQPQPRPVPLGWEEVPEGWGQPDDGNDDGSGQRQENGPQNRTNERADYSSDNSDNEDDDFEDNASLLTAATAEENELRGQGIQVEDVKSLVDRRSSRFSNAFMLRVRNEIRKLKRNNLWDRNVNRAPLSSYYLQELFKD